MDLKEIDSGIDPKTHWYYQAKKRPLLNYVNRVIRMNGETQMTLIDVGSGSGFFMQELIEKFPGKFKSVYLVDINYSDDEIASSKSTLKQKTRDIPDNLTNAIIILMDVLEHVADDTALLQEIKRKSNSNVYYFITVPAWPWLWSNHDKYLGHYRRYTKSTLSSIIYNSNMLNLHVGYIFHAILFPAAIKRKFSKTKNKPNSDMKKPKTIINWALRQYHKIEMLLPCRNGLPGLSVISWGYITAPSKHRTYNQ